MQKREAAKEREKESALREKNPVTAPLVGPDERILHITVQERDAAFERFGMEGVKALCQTVNEYFGSKTAQEKKWTASWEITAAAFRNSNA